MPGPELNDQHNNPAGGPPDRPDEDDLASLARRQRLVSHVVQDTAREAAAVRYAPPAPRTAATLHPHDEPLRGAPSATPPRTQTTLPNGVRETPSMYDQDLQSLADTRNLQRGVAPTPGTDLQAQVTPNIVTDGSLRSYAVGVRKISNAGIILKVPAAAHDALQAHEELWLALKLPNRPRPARIASIVRHRLSDGTDYVYGCEFDWSATNDPLGIAEDLLDYVLETSED